MHDPFRVDEPVVPFPDDLRQLRRVQQIASRDREVTGADKVAAIKTLRPVQPGRVVENRVVGHPDLLRRTFHHGRER